MGRDRFTLAFDHHNMVPAPAGVAAVKTIFKTEDGIMICYGNTVPSDAAAGYAPSCIFHQTDADVLASGTVDSGDATSLIDATLTSTFDSNDELIGLYVINERNQTMGLISDYAQSTGDITVADWTDYDGIAVSNAAPDLPVAGDAFKILRVATGQTIYVNQGDRARGSKFRILLSGSASNYSNIEMHRGPSLSIWENCPVVEYGVDPSKGMHFFDDIIDGIDVATGKSAAAAAALGTTGKFGAFTGSTANTIVTLATNYQGAAVLSTDTDNESAMIVWPKGATVAGKVKFTVGKKLWFEVRIQVSTIANSISQLFIGLAEEALNSAGSLLLINEAGMADKDYVGFVKEYADGGNLNTDFNTESGGASPVSNSNAVALAAATWTKLGMYSDGTTLTFYKDGIALADTFLLAATDFPIDEEMAFYLENMCGAVGTVGTVTIDWLRIAQEY